MGKGSIPAAVRNAVWLNTNGRVFDAKCACCKLENISVFNYHCGHIKSRANGGDTSISNLLPICQTCNTSMGSIDMDEFMKKYLNCDNVKVKPAVSVPITETNGVESNNILVPRALGDRYHLETLLMGKKICVHALDEIYCGRLTDGNILGMCNVHK